MYIEESIQHYLDELASAQPTPGGGSASALSGALGAALASMVCRLTPGKAGYEEVQTEIEHIWEQTEQLRTRFAQLLQEDIDAYGRLSTAYKMPRATDEERSERATAIQQQVVKAALVPLEVVECAAQLAQYCERIAEIGNTNVLSDIVAAVVLADASAGGAASMVRINLRAMKDTALAGKLEERLASALQVIAQHRLEVAVIVGRRA
ncbi:MAG TPA: cyclodeaminase/cyclohydrolase family protein [Ktedonobacteraceae bacterium]|nr:cyclodeaminase/cyclohydrolase family protein [Ktedonobacteraceae bacterium]